MAPSFKRAALGAYRHLCGTFRNLDLPVWEVTDGEQRISVVQLREIDTGAAAIDDDESATA